MASIATSKRPKKKRKKRNNNNHEGSSSSSSSNAVPFSTTIVPGTVDEVENQFELMVGSKEKVKEFFDTTWEKKPRVYRNGDDCKTTPPFHNFKKDNLMEILHFAQAAHKREKILNRWEGPRDVLLFMKNRTPNFSYESPFHAYLDGASIICNHMEYYSKAVYSLCVNLRKTFPHVFVNTYLTPPNSQAVAPHADDRDVLVWQSAGKKKWIVYKDPPIPFPYHKEQVGKSNEYQIPDNILKKTAEPYLEITLNPGDILYIPRGYVHEAYTSKSNPSFHLTIALKTDDWSFANQMEIILMIERNNINKNLVQQFRKWADTIDENGTNLKWRHSVPPHFICEKLKNLYSDAEKKRTFEDIIRSLSGYGEMNNIQQFINVAYSLSFTEFEFSFGCYIFSKNMPQDIEFRGEPRVRKIYDEKANKTILGPDSYVRRLTREEKEERSKKNTDDDNNNKGGIVARDCLSSYFGAILQSINDHTPVRIGSFGSNEENTGMLCAWSKVCFAYVCVELGILIPCEKECK